MSLLAVVRIHGMTGVIKDRKETMNRLRLRRKFTCILMKDNEENLHLLKRIESFVAYGKIDTSTLIELLKHRGQVTGNKKINPEEIARTLEDSKNNIEDFGLKPFFRLHPPRGGIETKHHFPKGILGDNKEKINELVRRML